MKKLMLIILAAAGFSALYAQDVTYEKMRVVVLPGADSSVSGSIQSSDTLRPSGNLTGILNMTIEQMERLGRFEVIDRRTTEQKMEELKLKLYGLTDDEAVIELGIVLSSDIGMLVDLVSFNTTQSEKKIEVETDDSVQVRYETVYDSVIDITVRQFEINTARTMKTITVSGDGSAGSSASAEAEAFRTLRSRLYSSLKEFYPLLLKVSEVRGKYILLSGGENIGVKKGMKFDVMASIGDFNRKGLVLVEKTSPDSSVARILKGFASIEPGYLLEERINKFPETAISAAVSRDFEDRITALDFSVEFNTFSPFSGGFDILFTVTDPEADFLRTNIFAVYKPLLGDVFDFGIRGGGGVTFLYGVRDDEDHRISSLELQFSIGAIATSYLNEKIAVFCAADYFFYPVQLMDWSYFTGEGEDRTRHDAVGDTPDIDPDGFYLTAGIKIIP